MTFYHVTHIKNLASIMAKGVRPDLSEGARPFSWYVKRKDVAWAFIHCAKRHGWYVRELVAVEIDYPCMEVSKHSNTNLYFTSNVYGPASEDCFLTFSDVADDLPGDER